MSSHDDHIISMAGGDVEQHAGFCNVSHPPGISPCRRLAKVEGRAITAPEATK